MRWYSGKGEFAFLSVGGTANGIIAIGGVAQGIVAIGGALSVGVISIGMNAVGSVAAIGMNTAAPISLALINGLGVYTLAGVNGWGAWTWAGVNATGAASRGGVNNEHSVLPGILVAVALLVASFVVRGERASRNVAQFATRGLRQFLRSTERDGPRVHATLLSVQQGAIELGGDGETLLVTNVDEPALESATSIAMDEAKGIDRRMDVVVRLLREEEVLEEDDPANYRARPEATKTTVVRCVGLERAAQKETWLPTSTEEVQWVLAWSARFSAVLSVVALAWLLAK